jgi:hypothetical protein
MSNHATSSSHVRCLMPMANMAGCYLRDWGRIWPCRALFHPKRSARVGATVRCVKFASRTSAFSSSRSSLQQPKQTLARVPVHPRDSCTETTPTLPSIAVCGCYVHFLEEEEEEGETNDGTVAGDLSHMHGQLMVKSRSMLH